MESRDNSPVVSSADMKEMKFGRWKKWIFSSNLLTSSVDQLFVWSMHLVIYDPHRWDHLEIIWSHISFSWELVNKNKTIFFHLNAIISKYTTLFKRLANEPHEYFFWWNIQVLFTSNHWNKNKKCLEKLNSNRSLVKEYGLWV